MHRKRVSVADYPPPHTLLGEVHHYHRCPQKKVAFRSTERAEKRERARERLKPRKGDERKDSILHPYK